MVAPNDSFANAIEVSIPTIGAVHTTPPVDDAGATMESGEPSNSTVGSARSLWWKYTPAHTGEATITIDGDNLPYAHLGIYVGNAVNALNEISAGRFYSETLTVQAGVTYYLRSARRGDYYFYGGNTGITVTGQTTTVTRAPAAPTLKLIPENNTLYVQWGVGYQTTWEIRINAGAWISKGAVGDHTFTGLTVGSSYTVEVRGTNSFGTGATASRTLVLPNMLVYDEFTRANSTTTVGAGTVGPTPASLSSTWGISSNQAYIPSVSTHGVLVWECGTANVDIRFKRTAGAVDSGGIFFGQLSGSTVDGWYAYFNGGSGTSHLARYAGNTMIQLLQGRGDGAITQSSVLRLVHHNQIVQMWSDSTLLLAAELPEPVRGTRHGIRFTSNTHRADDLTIRESSEITLASDQAALVTQNYATRRSQGLEVDAFVYRGRDTKTLDVAGGA